MILPIYDKNSLVESSLVVSALLTRHDRSPRLPDVISTTPPPLTNVPRVSASTRCSAVRGPSGAVRRAAALPLPATGPSDRRHRDRPHTAARHVLQRRRLGIGTAAAAAGRRGTAPARTAAPVRASRDARDAGDAGSARDARDDGRVTGWSVGQHSGPA